MYKYSTPVRIVQYDPTIQQYTDLGSSLGLPVMDTWRIANGQQTATSYQTMVEVPYNQEWQLLWLAVDYTSDATVGDRQLEHQIRLEGNIVGRFLCGVAQAASLTYTYQFAPGMPDFTAVRDGDFVASPLLAAATLLRPEMRVYVLDRNAVSISDVINVRYQYAFRTITTLY